jgi:hypothetical protein
MNMYQHKIIMKSFISSTIIFFCITFSVKIYAQEGKPTQTIRGTVTDAASGQPLPFVAVVLDNSTTGTTTADDGTFTINNVSVGRHMVQASFVGYETAIMKELLVGSAREVYLEVKLTEKPMELNEVVIRAKINKAEPLNKMATLGARMFSVEEAGRFAGGMDDPARLASGFAGVVPTAANDNSISIHGNAPSLLQWRIEGIEVPNPNHFADVVALGGGLISGLSSHVVGNSDFFIGAFPAEYSNAVSGVFDMRLRNGNNQKYQHTFQLGVMGIDFASEGPISKKNNSSYIINYRYSTTGLLSKIARDMEPIGFQDLNVKLNFPTRKAGTFSLWGIGLSDKVSPGADATDTLEWTHIGDGILSYATQSSGAAGLSHRYLFGNRKTSLHTTLAATVMQSDIDEEFYNLFYDHHDAGRSSRSNMIANTRNLVLTSAINHKFNARHTNKTGITLTNIAYDMQLDFANLFGDPLQNYIMSNGNTNLLSAYSSSQINMGERFTLTAGITAQYLTLSKKAAVEPRIGLKWQATQKSSLAIGYGLHSRMEKPDVYFVKDEHGNQPNRKLGFTKSHHLMLSYAYRISEDMNLKVEPYYQHLFDVPVAENGSYSILNRNMYYVTEILVGKGFGRNYGVDITFERYFMKGLYYTVTASLFESKYCGGDKVWHDSKYNRNFMVNGMIGKEWMFGNNMLGINLKATVLGGQRYTPVDEAATLAHPDRETQYDESRMYVEQFSPQLVGDISISYKINRRHVAHEFALKTVNATGQKDYAGHLYNLNTGVIEPKLNKTSLFNLSYKIEF